MEEIQRALGRIEGKLDSFDQRFERIEGLYTRVNALEGWRKWILGVQAAIGAGVLFFIRMLK